MADDAASSRPIDPAERIDAIDVLRGIALFGVMAINIVTEFRVSIFAQFISYPSPTSPVDRAVEAILTLFVELKAFALFSLLFGVGLAIQFDRLANSGRRTSLLVRRLTVLLAFGLIHLCLLFSGDILTEYALVGLIVLPILFGSRWLLAVAALASLALYLAMQSVPPPGLFPDRARIWYQVVEATRIYPTGGFLDVLAFRLRELPYIFPLHVFIIPRTIGLFLIGALAWRTGMVQSPPRRLLLIGLPCIGLGLALILAGMEALGTIVLALGYAATIVGSARLQRGARLLGWAAPLGRMAFTNYLTQSLIFGWVFYGYGLGLFGRIGAASALAIGIAVYIGQVFSSSWWLRRYRYGPVEWLWRTLMYGVPQPMSLLKVEALR